MRPISLEISGLRSYRGRAFIPFPDAGGLIGVIGDTGSGKSSILEAIVAALYGRTSWKRGDLSDLRNSSESTMRIVFTFEVDGRGWRVTRTSSRNNYPPAVHELVCLDDEDETYSGRSEVTEKIVELVGLDYDAFKSAVILPQGNFERLLKASEADRIEILMSILRLNQLHEVREQAQDVELGLTKLIGRADVVRAGFGDPERDAAAAADSKLAATERRDALREAANEIASIDKSIAAATQRLIQLNASASALASVPTGSATELQKLAVKLQRIEAAREELVNQQSREQASADSLREQLEEAARNGESVEALASAQTVLETRIRELPDFDSQDTGLAERSAALAQRRAELTDLRNKRDASKLNAEQFQRVAHAIAESFEQASVRYAAAASAVERVRESSGLVERAEQAANAARAALQPAQAALDAAALELAEARLAEQRAASDLLEAHRADHAAAAAEGLVSGDPCPVCNQVLPCDFVAPAPSEVVAAATRRNEEAREATVHAAAAEAGARQHLRTVEAAIESTALAQVEVQAHCSSDRAALREYLEVDPDLQLETPVILKELLDDRRRLLGERDRTVTVARAAASESSERETAVLLVEQAISTEEAAIAREAQQLESRRAVSETCRLGLPTAFRPEAKDGGPVVQIILDRLQGRLKRLAEIATARDVAMEGAASAARGLTELVVRQRTEVDEPSHSILRNVATLGDRARSAADLLNADEPPPLDEHLPLEALADAAEQLEQAVGNIQAQLSNNAGAVQVEIDLGGMRTSKLLASVEVDTSEQLQHELELAGAEMLRWQAAEQRARDLVEAALRLDQAIAPVRDRAAALEEVATLLRRDAFVKDVCERRQQALLGHASRILLSMTNQRYGFDRKFAIADTLTGVARKVDTLSGGETFLASLALALGLVEVARLSGGRLDAIFLDEGFGSLDQATLDQAVAALDAAAIEGRTVAVVTHVRRVMDNIDRILAVSRGPEGSRAKWLDAKEREDLVEQDVTAGMLA